MAACESDVALLTGGMDRPYAFGLMCALASRGARVDVVCGAELDGYERSAASELNFVRIYGDQRQRVSSLRKILRHLRFYWRLIRYSVMSKAKVFHILWNYRFTTFDRTALMLYYKLLGKRIVLTAHNVNAGKRDSNDSALNRFTLKLQYRFVDHIFVHTDKMKQELMSGFTVSESKISVIPFGLNDSVPNTDLQPADARSRLGLNDSDKVVLFFGGIRPYKGVEFLVAAFQQFARGNRSHRLIIAGQPKKEALQYWEGIQQEIEKMDVAGQITQHIRFIADEETEVYFKAADVAVLPYTEVFQSGVLFLAYSFGLPVIATNVGSLREDILEGHTGYTCRPCDETDLARAIDRYFESDLYGGLQARRAGIRAFAQSRNSWSIVGEKTCSIYAQLLEQAS
jgi:glycosyltransferase involved in cell wall biosynthesis